MRQKSSRPKLLQAMMDAFSLPDLRRRILITIGILVAFRFICHVPLPGLDADKLNTLFESNALLGMLDLFSGGAMKQFSVASMGVYPYITASIIIILLVPVIPKLQALSQEGEAGKNKINLITHWLTVPLAGLSGYGQLIILQRSGAVSRQSPDAHHYHRFIINRRHDVPGLAGRAYHRIRHRQRHFDNYLRRYRRRISATNSARLPGQEQPVGLAVYIAIVLITVVLIVIFTEAHRRVPVQYARSVFRGGKMYRQSGTTHIPLRVNSSGMIPLIFSMSIMLFPGIVASYFVNTDAPGFADTIVKWFSS